MELCSRIWQIYVVQLARPLYVVKAPIFLLEKLLELRWKNNFAVVISSIIFWLGRLITLKKSTIILNGKFSRMFSNSKKLLIIISTARRMFISTRKHILLTHIIMPQGNNNVPHWSKWENAFTTPSAYQIAYCFHIFI